MNTRVETPPALRGEAEQQLTQINSYLFRLSETLNVELDRISGAEGSAKAQTQSATGLGVREYRELRDMIGASGKELARMMNEKIPIEVTTQLRIAEQSGDFDGNGISFVQFNNDHSITFGFTDGTFFSTPSLKGDKGDNFQFAVGDIFSTTRDGNAADLLGYGVWELAASSPVYMWQRIE